MKRFVKAASGSDGLKNIIDRAKREIKNGRSVDEAIEKISEEFGLAEDGKICKHIKSLLEDIYIDKAVTASIDPVDLFLKYHDDQKNYDMNPNGFNDMYEILEKYDDSNGNDTVDVAFRKATPEDQKKMIELITPGKWALKPTDKEYSRNLYYDALNGEAYDSREANEAVVDVFESLFDSGWLNENDFRTDL